MSIPFFCRRRLRASSSSARDAGERPPRRRRAWRASFSRIGDAGERRSQAGMVFGSVCGRVSDAPGLVFPRALRSCASVARSCLARGLDVRRWPMLKSVSWGAKDALELSAVRLGAIGLTSRASQDRAWAFGGTLGGRSASQDRGRGRDQPRKIEAGAPLTTRPSLSWASCAPRGSW